MVKGFGRFLNARRSSSECSSECVVLMQASSENVIHHNREVFNLILRVEPQLLANVSTVPCLTQTVLFVLLQSLSRSPYCSGVPTEIKDTTVLATGFGIYLNTTLPSRLERETGGSDDAAKAGSRGAEEYDAARGLEQILRV